MDALLPLSLLISVLDGAGRTYIVVDTLLTWNQARDHCLTEYGSTLATVIDAEDEAAYISAIAEAGQTGVWLSAGLTDQETEGVWVWEDGSDCSYTGPGPCIDYWSSGEPNNSGGVQYCMRIYKAPNDNPLIADDGDCDAGQGPLVCNAATTTVTTTPVTTTTVTTTPVTTTTVNVTTATCGEPAAFVWEELLESGINKPDITHGLNIDKATLALSIDVTVPYLGKSQADDNGYVYGTTYVLDFEDYSAHSDDITSPGTCQNRLASDFANKSWDEVWAYSSTSREVGTASYLAYAPGNDWTLTMADTCHYITYSATFTWDELTSCTDADSSRNYVATVDDVGSITLSGTFYVNVVSPYDYNYDYAFYRVYQLLSQPFQIVVNKTVYVVDSVGINLLTMDIVAVYKEEKETIFKLVVLTESAEYLKLTRSSLSDGLFSFAATTSSLTKDDFTIANYAETDNTTSAANGCLNNKGYICSQLWVITAANAQCIADIRYTDFSGTFGIEFVPKCRSTAELSGDTATDLNEYCTTWLEDHLPELQNADHEVILTSPLTWTDEICDPQTFEVQFNAAMEFFVNGYTDPASPNELYQVGEDSVYVRIETDYPSDHLSVFQVELQNVWICTFDPLTPPSLDINPAERLGGCFSEDPVPDTADPNDYKTHIYDITKPGEEYEGFALDIVSVLASNIIQFKFDVPGKIVRDQVYIHAQIEISLGSGRRRRMMLSGNAHQETVNQMDHFVDHIGITKEPRDYKPQPQPHHYEPQEPVAQPYTPPQQPFVISLHSPWILAIGALLALVLTANIAFMCYVNCIKNRRRGRYTPVKYSDSEFNSEPDAINVVYE